MKKNLKRRMLAMLLAFVMVFAMMPQMAAFGLNGAYNDSIVYAEDKDDVNEAVDIYMAAMARLFNRENNLDFEELAKCMEHLENLETVYSLAEGTVSILEAMGIIEDPTDAMLSQILSSVEAVQDQLQLMDSELKKIIQSLYKMNVKGEEQARFDEGIAYGDRWETLEIGPKDKLHEDLNVYQAHIEDGKKAWCEEEQHESLRVLYAKDDDGTGLMHVYSSKKYDQGVPDKSDAGEAILKDECIGLPGSFIPEISYDKKNWTTDVNAGMQTAFTNAANAGQLDWTAEKQSQWNALSSDDKEKMAKQYAGDLTESLLHVISCKKMSNEHTWAASVYSHFETFCNEVKKPQYGMDALIQLYYNSYGLEGEAREAIEETCDSVIVTTGYYGTFLFNLMGQDDEYDGDDIKRIQATWADTIKKLAEMKKNSISGHDNFSYITGTLIDYKKMSTKSTVTMHFAGYQKDADKGVINEGVDSDPWKLVDENNKEQKELSIADGVDSLVLFHQFRQQSKNGQQTFAKYLKKYAVQIPDDFSGKLTTDYQGAKTIPLSGDDVPSLLSSKVMGKYFKTEKYYQLDKTKYDVHKFVLHDMVMHDCLDCEKGTFTAQTPLVYRAAFSDSSGWWVVDEMYAFRGSADFDKKNEFKWKEPKHWRYGSPKYHYDRIHYLSAPVNVLTSSPLEQATSAGPLKTLKDDIDEHNKKKSLGTQPAYSKANWSKMNIDNLDLYPDNDTRMDNGINKAINIAVEAAEDNGLKVSLTKKQKAKLVKQMKKKTFEMQKELKKSGIIRQMNIFGIDGNNAKELKLAERTLQGTYLSSDGKSLIPSENMNTMAEYEPYAVLHFEKKNGKVKPVIEAAFDVTPLVVIWDPNTQKFYGTPVDNEDIKAMGLSMKVRLPASFIKTKYAKVIHYDSAQNLEIIGKKTLKVRGKGNNKYVEMPATSGSPFELRSSKGPGIGGSAPAKMTAKGKNKLVLSWGKVKGAEGYDIFLSKSRKASHKKVKTIKGNQTFKYTMKKLKKKTGYKANVKAWVMKDGKKKYINNSLLVRAYTSGGTKKYTNAKSVTVEKKSVSLQIGKKYTIKAKVNKLKKGKKLMPSSQVAKLRYISSNPKIATVSKIGKIKGVSKGKCTVYVYAQNGAHKKIKVTVR